MVFTSMLYHVVFQFDRSELQSVIIMLKKQPSSQVILTFAMIFITSASELNIKVDLN